MIDAIIEFATYLILHFSKPILLLVIISSFVQIFRSRRPQRSGEWVSLWILFGTMGFVGLQTAQSYDAFVEAKKPVVAIALSDLAFQKDASGFQTLLNKDGMKESKKFSAKATIINYGNNPAVINKSKLSITKDGKKLELPDPKFDHLPSFQNQPIEQKMGRMISLHDFDELGFANGPVMIRAEIEYQAMADQLSSMMGKSYRVWVVYSFDASSGSSSLVDGGVSTISGKMNIGVGGTPMNVRDIFLSETFWVALSALGTILVAVIAVWKENFVPQPKLTLEEQNFKGKPTVLSAGDGLIGIPACYYHLRVRNLKPNVPGKNVMVFCNSIKLLGGGDETVRHIQPPLPLCWTPAEIGILSPTISTHRSLDFVRVLDDRLELTTIVMPHSKDHIVPRGQNVEVELEIYADNLSTPSKYLAKITWQAAKKPALAGLRKDHPCGDILIELRKEEPNVR